jgi:hypothetical protein
VALNGRVDPGVPVCGATDAGLDAFARCTAAKLRYDHGKPNEARGYRMLYDAYEFQRTMMAGASQMASFGAEMLNNPFAYLGGGAVIGSALEVFAHANATRGKPAFGFEHTLIDGREVAVREEIVLRKDFGQLKRFVREGVEGGPKLLIVAPMSGHYATLLRGTVERMLPCAAGAGVGGAVRSRRLCRLRDRVSGDDRGQ